MSIYRIFTGASSFVDVGCDFMIILPPSNDGNQNKLWPELWACLGTAGNPPVLTEIVANFIMPSVRGYLKVS